MKCVSIVAESAGEALVQVHEQLGPAAVVTSVRKLPASGLFRFWKPRGSIEVTAAVPENHLVADEEKDAPPLGVAGESSPPERTPRRWPSIARLESLGLLPEFADRLETRARAAHGDESPVTPRDEWMMVRDMLATFWQPARQKVTGTGRPHVFVGPAGAGKTTVLCKWLTAAVLAHHCTTRVWRLDSETANTSEFLSLHCEMIGVPVERFWDGIFLPEDLLFVDLPGVETRNREALAALRVQAASLPRPHVHLVLDAATETAILFEQMHAFAPLVPEDVIFTHLDEETRRVKLWNFVLGTNLPVSFLSAGQKIPGEFFRATPAHFFPSPNRQ